MGIGFEHDMESIWLETDLIERGVYIDDDLFLADYEVENFLDSEFDTGNLEMAY